MAPIAVIYQDHHHLIVNKPAGIVIHPTYKHADGTYWDALLAYSQQQEPDDWQPPQLPDHPGWAAAPPQVQAMLRQQRLDRLWKEEGLLARPCLLHRLDKDTSGIVALARTERSRRYLVQQFEQRTLSKRYLALVQLGAPDWARPRAPFQITWQQAHGPHTPVPATFLSSLPPGDTLRLSGPLQRDPEDRRRCIVGPDGQEATTIIRLLSQDHNYLLLEVQPITGRTHQIRAHLAALGFAIVGDATYAPTLTTDIPRQFLHASRLDLRCYPTGELHAFVAPLADDLAQWLAFHSPVSSQSVSITGITQIKHDHG